MGEVGYRVGRLSEDGRGWIKLGEAREVWGGWDRPGEIRRI